MLTIYIDFKSAASYLTLEPTLALIQETGIEAQWLPFSSRAFIVPAKQPEETVGERHRRVRAIAQRDTHLHYANLQKLTMQFAHDPTETDLALSALAMMDADPVPFIEAAFKAYWADQADLNDKAIVSGILKDCALGAPDWLLASEKLGSIREDAQDKKVFETPTYLINDQIFVGREHLPWITAMIESS